VTTHSGPPDQWRIALDRFSLAHFAWPVSVEIVSPAIGAQPEVLELPLDGISVNDAGGHPAIAISMSRDLPEHVTHIVEDVSNVYILRDGNVDRALEIVAGDGTRTILRFSSPGIAIVSTSVH
jgi:hypothetical protein